VQMLAGLGSDGLHWMAAQKGVTVNERVIRWRLWVPLAIVVATVLAYVNAFSNPFLFDDEAIITANPDTQVLFPLAFAGRWLVNLTFKLNYAVGQFRVADYHATNLMIHLAAALLLFGWVRRTLLLPRAGEVWPRHAAGLAGAIAGLWAVHPLQTESVTYICQRYESLMGLCFVGTLYTFVRGVQARGRGGASWFGVSLAICVLGMGTKEIMVTAPLVVLLYDCLLGAGSAGEAVRKRWRVHLGLWLTLIVFGFLEWQMFNVVAQQGEGVTLAVPPVSYLLTQMQVIPHYIRLSFVPYPLCFDYGWPFVTSWTRVVLPGTFLVGLGVLTLLLWVRGRSHAFLGLWFFIILAPTSSIVPVPDAAFEHRMYLPLASVISAAVLGSYWLLRGAMASRQRTCVLGGGVVLAGMVVAVMMTHQRNLAYRSGLTMWQSVVSVRPQNHRARLNLGSALLRGARYAEAEAEGREVARQLDYCAALGADDVPAWGEDAAGAAIYREARHYALAHNIIGVASIHQGDTTEAEKHFREAVRLLPQFADADRNLAELIRTKEKPRQSGAFLSD
jgi:hypothetical protein